MPTFSSDELRELSEQILEGVGTPPEGARIVSAALVDANLVGHDSHGVIRLMSYIEFVQRKQVQPAAVPKVDSQNMAVAHVDNAWAWGQLGAQLATEVAIGLAKQYGIAAVTIDRCNHVGRLGEYVETMARAGLIGIGMCNGDAAVAPFGGFGRVLGTNPFAWSAPRGGGHDPLLSDFATSGVAEGKLRVARAKGEHVAPGLIVDRYGKPSQDPDAFYDGGALLPFGEHKGYGLSVMVELFGGILSGLASTVQPDFIAANGTLLLALDISKFLPIETYLEQVEAACAKIKATPPAEGFKQVLLPGEPEWQTRAQRLKTGISLPEKTWDDLQALRRDVQAGSMH